MTRNWQATAERERRRQLPPPQRDLVSLVPPDWPAELARAERERWDGPAMLDLPPRLARYDRGARWRKRLAWLGEAVLLLTCLGALWLLWIAI